MCSKPENLPPKPETGPDIKPETGPDRGPEAGFSLTELTTTLAVIGIIAAALIAAMTNLNQQSERMNTQTDLLLAGKQIFELVEPWAALAGDKQGSSALDADDALVLSAADEIRFCYDKSASDREVRQFRVSDKKLQMRSKIDAACTPDSGDAGWEDLTEQVVGGLTFSSAAGSTYSLDVVVDLERIVPGTDETVGLRMRKRMNLFSMTRY